MWVGCALAVLIRYFLFFLGAPDYLEEHLEINSPMTSYITLKEGLFLMGGGASPYAGAVCHHPPLVLLLFAPLRQAPAVAHFTLVVLADVATALLLRLFAVQYAAARARAGAPWLEASMKMVESSASAGASAAQQLTALENVVSPAFVGLSYLFNPFVMAGCLATSLQNFHHLAICGSICLAGSGRVGAAAASLAMLLYLCPMTPLVLVLPVAYLALSQRRPTEGAEEALRAVFRSKDLPVLERGLLPRLIFFVIGVLLLLACLYAASAAVVGFDLRFLQATVVSVLTLRDLTPNVGIFWYLFIEVFDRYRGLFLLAFHAHVLFYPIPLHLRIGRHQPVGPWIHCTAAIGIISIFKPYSTASDFGLMISALLVQAELIRQAEASFAFLLSGLLFGICMFPAMAAVWLTRNAGNANFLYNMTLVINVFSGLLLTEWLRAGLKLRKRMHQAAFCRGILLDALDERLRGLDDTRRAKAEEHAAAGAPAAEAEALR